MKQRERDEIELTQRYKTEKMGGDWRREKETPATIKYSASDSGEKRGEGGVEEFSLIYLL